MREAPTHLVRDLFEIKAEEIIDPTLILPTKYYHMLADAATNIDISEPYLLTYLLDYNKDKEQAALHIAKILGLKLVNIASANMKEWKHKENSQLEYDRNYSPEEFLQLYRNASFVVTDSFHGTCFSINFRRQFVSLINFQRGAMRYKLFEKLGLKSRFYSSSKQLMNTDRWQTPIDYSYTAQIQEKEARKARKLLKKYLHRLLRKKRMYVLRNLMHKVRDYLRKKRGKTLNAQQL